MTALSAPIGDWEEGGLHVNLTPRVAQKLDQIMEESFLIKEETLRKVNEMLPIDYEFNSNKSLPRIAYEDEEKRRSRIRNNNASRLSRNRKKHQNVILHHSRNFDVEAANQLIDEIVVKKKATINLEGEVQLLIEHLNDPKEKQYFFQKFAKINRSFLL